MDLDPRNWRVLEYIEPFLPILRFATLFQIALIVGWAVIAFVFFYPLSIVLAAFAGDPNPFTTMWDRAGFLIADSYDCTGATTQSEKNANLFLFAWIMAMLFTYLIGVVFAAIVWVVPSIAVRVAALTYSATFAIAFVVLFPGDCMGVGHISRNGFGSILEIDGIFFMIPGHLVLLGLIIFALNADRKSKGSG